MTYHCLPIHETSYKKIGKTDIDQKEFIWTAGCEFINRSGNDVDLNLNQIKVQKECQIINHTSEVPDETDGDKQDESNVNDEPKCISDKEDKMLLKKFKNQGRRNAICEMNADERHGFPRVLKHYIHLKTFHKCGLG